MLQKSYLPQNAINILSFLLTCAQKFKYQPSHLNVKQVQNYISQATLASYVYGISLVV